MGEILNYKTLSRDKNIFKLKFDEHEARLLRNRIHNVHLFDEELCVIDTEIIERGKNFGAKYFVVPKSLRTRKKSKISKVTYQKIETEKRVFFICVATKNTTTGIA